MDTVICKEVIITTLSRKGNGKTTPMRVVTEIWDKEGHLLAEDDSEQKLHRIEKTLQDVESIGIKSMSEVIKEIREIIKE